MSEDDSHANDIAQKSGTLWAPAEALWSQWAKPVLIAQLADAGPVSGAIARLAVARPQRCCHAASDRTAIVVDLATALLAVNYGLALAKRRLSGPCRSSTAASARRPSCPPNVFTDAMVAGGPASCGR